MSRNHWWFGVALVVLGFLFLLNNLGVANINVGEAFGLYWPVLLILWGINVAMARNREGGSLLSGAILFAIGFIILGNNLGFLNINMAIFWKAFWPLILILAGISLVKGPLIRGRNNVAFLGGMDRTKGNWKLQSGGYWAFMGGIDLDLRCAEIEEKEYLLCCTAILGGINIIVPPDVTVICDGTAVLGGIEFLDESSGGIYGSASAKQEGKGTGGALIKIYGRAFLGGIVVTRKE
jgi:predicted membrane protein